MGGSASSSTPTHGRGGGEPGGAHRIETVLGNIPGAPSFQADIISSPSPNSTRRLSSGVTSTVDCFLYKAPRAGVSPPHPCKASSTGLPPSSRFCAVPSPVPGTQQTLAKHTWGWVPKGADTQPRPVCPRGGVSSRAVRWDIAGGCLRDGISSAPNVWRRWLPVGG